jgi:hypothetical protein
MRVLAFFIILSLSSAAVMAQSSAGKRAAPPEIRELKLQRSSYPATLTADCIYVGDGFDMDCSFFISRVAARRSDGRVNEMLLRMYGDRTREEWQQHPICVAPQVKDLERHIRVMKIQKKISRSEEDMIRRENEPAVAFCTDPTLEHYRAYLQALANEVSCTVSTTAERVTMRYDADSQSWSGLFIPKSDRKPNTEYQIKLDSVTGQVGQRLIFMVTQLLRPKGGGRPQQLIYRAKRADQKHYCGYVEW